MVVIINQGIVSRDWLETQTVNPFSQSMGQAADEAAGPVRLKIFKSELLSFRLMTGPTL